MWEFEVGAIDARHIDLTRPTAVTRKDEDKTRTQERDAYYNACRSVLLVHRIARSRITGQEFDILIYLIPHEDRGTLQSIQKVEYFLGPFWQSVIFTSSNRSAGFPVRLSAYGPTLCSAKLYFTDGAAPVTLFRYLDFEMGDSAPLLKDD